MTYERHPVATFVVSCLVGLVLLAAIVLGGWAAGWWFTNQNVNREARAIRHSYGYQQTYREQVTKGIGDVLAISSQIAVAPTAEIIPLKAQRKAILDQLCQQAEQISGDPLPADQASFVAANCEAGTVNPNSEYAR